VIRRHHPRRGTGRWWRGLLLALPLALTACPSPAVTISAPATVSPTRSTAALGIDYAPETLVVWQVLPGSAAERAGLQVGDQLLAVEGLPLRRAGDEVRIVESRQPGERVLVTVQRGTLQITTQVVLQRRGE
jgi:S1-C subfamily serine protease